MLIALLLLLACQFKPDDENLSLEISPVASKLFCFSYYCKNLLSDLGKRKIILMMIVTKLINKYYCVTTNI